MTAAREPDAASVAALEAALDAGALPDLAGLPADALETALHAVAKRHGAGAVPLLLTIADKAAAKDHRRIARRELYRLEQAGIAAPAAAGAAAAGPVVKREVERPVRAWLSGIDGTGSRAAWILFEGGLGAQLSLCSLILNDEAGILETAGGAITKKRLEVELRRLRQDQKLPWVESDPAEARARVDDALALHERAGTAPVPEFARWRRFFSAAPAVSRPEPASDAVDPALLERSAELADLPEMSGWFLDPGSLHEDAIALLQARESRLVVSEQIKAEREAAIVDAAVERVVTGPARHRWAHRLAEMAAIFRATDRDEPARLADTTAAALLDSNRAARAIPFVRALAARGLEMGAEVVLGRVKLAEVSRAPARRRSAG